MNYEILYDYANKNNLSYNELCSTVNKAAEADLYALDECRQELARIYSINQNLLAKARQTTDFILKTRQPLLASIIVTLYPECPQSDSDMIEFAREIEQLHGIK